LISFGCDESLSRPAAVNGQNDSGDERIFEQRDNGLRDFLDRAETANRVDAFQPVSLGGCLSSPPRQNGPRKESGIGHFATLAGNVRADKQTTSNKTKIERRQS
jgi:hypothetical protein